jgi:hypothetical protein
MSKARTTGVKPETTTRKARRQKAERSLGGRKLRKAGHNERKADERSSQCEGFPEQPVLRAP